MATELNTDPEMVKAYPYAVGVQTPEHVEYLHFSDKGAADLFAHMLDDGTLKRFVATSFDSTWREVTWFSMGADDN